MRSEYILRSLLGDDQRARYTVLVVGGMHTAACVSRVEAALRTVQGVETAGVNLLTRLATVRHSPKVEPDELVVAVDAAGYQASIASPGPSRHQSFGDAIDLIASRRTRFAAGAVFTMLLLLVERGVASNNVLKMLLLFLLATPVQVTVGWEYYRGFFRALRQGQFNFDSLIVTASTAAYVQGFLCFIGQVSADADLMKWTPQFHSAAIILTVVSLGKWLESRACESTARIWGDLSDMAPREARVLRDGREQNIPAGVVAIGDIVLVKPGELIPVDGEVLEGRSEVNEEQLTGDAQRALKTKGDRVSSATQNGSGMLRLKALGVGGQTALARITRLVREASARKSGAEQAADRIAAILVPAMMMLSLLCFILWYIGPLAVLRLENLGYVSAETSLWMHDGVLRFLFLEPSVPSALNPALAVLVAACPYALGLATPMVVSVVTGVGARRGIVVKGGAALESAARATDIVFCEEGVLTGDVWNMQSVLASGIDENELLSLAAALVGCSSDPSAGEVAREARKRNLILPAVSDYEPLRQGGMAGVIAGARHVMGSEELMSDLQIETPPDLAERIAKAESAGARIICLAREGGPVLGAVALAGKVKDTAAVAVDELRRLGLKIHLLSSQTTASAQFIGSRCGIDPDNIQGGLSIENKVDYLRTLHSLGRTPAAVGDGVDDAPVFASADAGFVMSRGVDAPDCGSIVLAAPDLRGPSRTVQLARLSGYAIKWNLFCAFAANAMLLPLAFLNQLDPVLGVSVMACSSIVIVLSSLSLHYWAGRIK